MSAVRPSIARNGPRVDGFVKKPFTLIELLALAEDHAGKPEPQRDTA